MKNIIQWKRGSSLNSLDRISVMRNELDELKENERQLDNLIEKIMMTSNRQQECKQAYVMSQDLHNLDIYKEQMIMVVKAPFESQIILMDGDPSPLVLKSDKGEIDIFFCPDPSKGGMHQATAALDADSDDDGPSTSIRPHRKAASASANKRKGLGSAQRNLSKAFDEMVPAPRTARTKNNLLKSFNAIVTRESSDEGGNNTTEETEDEDELLASTTSFKSTAITTKDLMLLDDPPIDESSFGIKRDVKLSLFSPQKNHQSNGWTEFANLSPTLNFSQSDDPTAGFFLPLEPEAEYNFLLEESEGILDLFDI